MPFDEHGRSRSCGGGREDMGDRCPGLSREQHRVGLVLDLLQSGEIQGRAGVLVPDEAPQLRQKLRVALVASVGADRQGVVILGVRQHTGSARFLRRREVKVLRRDADLVESVADLVEARPPDR